MKHFKIGNDAVKTERQKIEKSAFSFLKSLGGFYADFDFLHTFPLFYKKCGFNALSRVRFFSVFRKKTSAKNGPKETNQPLIR